MRNTLNLSFVSEQLSFQTSYFSHHNPEISTTYSLPVSCNITSQFHKSPHDTTITRNTNSHISNVTFISGEVTILLHSCVVGVLTYISRLGVAAQKLDFSVCEALEVTMYYVLFFTVSFEFDNEVMK
jgi:hypothetical protein